MKLPYYVYVLQSRCDNKFYIGFTTDVEERLRRHGKGLVPSTAPRRPLELLFYECHTSKYDALRREAYFKSSAGKKALKLMLRDALKEQR